jgi:carbamoyltransferase
VSLTVGIGGVRRHASVALCAGGRLQGACEQERASRLRAAGVNASGLPDEALDLMLSRIGKKRQDIGKMASAEALTAPIDTKVELFDHHLGHAAAAYLPSSFDRAVILVCDHQAPGVSVWEGAGGRLVRTEWPWNGPGPASIYSEAVRTLGLTGSTADARFEALARLEPDAVDNDLNRHLRLAEAGVEGTEAWSSSLAAIDLAGVLDRGDIRRAAAIAGAVQNRIGELILELACRIRRSTETTDLCLAGSLFYNSSYCTRIKTSALFQRVFVPVNPGNAGLAVGTALLASGARPQLVSPFLGPSFDSSEIKSTLDNCKLTYEWVGETAATERAVEALSRGRLVGWFEGAMEFGPRALGARCILASPFSPYVLENLNRFLKHRQAWRGYALSGLDNDVHSHFEGPSDSPFMECDFVPRNPELFRHVLPQPAAAVRVQSVGAQAPPAFCDLLRRFGQATGTPILVNTSFNGFSEPIVCRPRDAVRVFYGTGLDMLVLDGFLLTK